MGGLGVERGGVGLCGDWLGVMCGGRLRWHGWLAGWVVGWLGGFLQCEEFFEFAKSVAGGNVPITTARENWAKWSAPDSGVLRCWDGPASAPLMLRVQTGVYVDSLNSFAIEKAMEMSHGAVRNPQAADIASMRQSVQSGHDMVGGMDTSDLSGLAQNLLTGSGGSSSGAGATANFAAGAFNFEGATDVSLRQHFIRQPTPPTLDAAEAPPGAGKKKKEDTENVDDAEKGSGSEAGETDLPTPKKKAKLSNFLDSRVTASKNSAWIIAIQEQRSTAKKCNESMAKISHKLEECSDSVGQAICAPTLKVLKEKLTPLAMILDTSGGSSDRLESEMLKYDSGKVPFPIEKYRNLKTLEVLQELGVAKYSACANAEDLKQAAKIITSHKQATQQLINVCAAVLVDAERALAGVVRVAKVGTKIEKDNKSAKEGKGPTFWDYTAEFSTPIPEAKAPLTDHDTFHRDLSKPFMVTNIDWVKRSIKDNNEMNVGVDLFKQKFSKWLAKQATEKRGGQSIRDPTTAKMCQALLCQSFGDAAFTQPYWAQASTSAGDCEALKKALEPSFFALAAGEMFASTELECLGTLRLAKEGIRGVVCTKWEDLTAFMRADTSDSGMTMEAAKKMLLGMTREKVEKYSKNNPNKIFFATCGVADLLYMPPGYIVAEITLNKSQVLGYRVGVLGPAQLADFTIQAMTACKEVVSEKVSKLVCGILQEEKVAAQALTGQKAKAIEASGAGSGPGRDREPQGADPNVGKKDTSGAASIATEAPMKEGAAPTNPEGLDHQAGASGEAKAADHQADDSGEAKAATKALTPSEPPVDHKKDESEAASASLAVQEEAAVAAADAARAAEALVTVDSAAEKKEDAKPGETDKLEGSEAESASLADQKDQEAAAAAVEAAGVTVDSAAERKEVLPGASSAPDAKLGKSGKTDEPEVFAAGVSAKEVGAANDDEKDGGANDDEKDVEKGGGAKASKEDAIDPEKVGDAKEHVIEPEKSGAGADGGVPNREVAEGTGDDE